ncbi:LytTR family DNA-binding domain-containing protein [Psychroserpens sp. AS72]|uniref:LytR/AlgR family response regulator transcription factor n=1 Tax=Psychroserpens sp. AS72 TaxID=3135775 RepID=UPI00316DD04F
MGKEILLFPVKVIVTTAYSEFVIDGYELNIVDYLLEPFRFERFLKAVNKVVDSNKKVKKPILEASETLPKRIFIRQNKSPIQLEIDTILYVEASGNYTKIITKTETITIRDKISDILESLPTNGFIQVHKSFAVATQYINKIDGNRIHIQDHIIPIGKLYKANLLKILN